MTGSLGAASCCFIRTASNGAKRCRCRKAEADPVPLDEGEPLNLECRHFLDCVATGGTAAHRWTRGSARSEGAGPRERSIAGPFAGGPGTEGAPCRADVQIHESAFVDEPCEIGAGTRDLAFRPYPPRTRIGRNCSLGQNVMVGPDVTIGDGCKIQNNVSIYKGVTLEDGVFCGPSCVFTNVNNPRAEIERKNEFRTTLVKRGATHRRQRDHRLRPHARRIRLHRRRRGGDKRRAGLRADGRRAGAPHRLDEP